MPQIKVRATISILLLAAFCSVFRPSVVASSAHISEFIFTTAPFKSCHASTIVELRNGDFLAAWFGGTSEGNPDVAIWASRRTQNGWSAPFQLVREPNTPTWNPVLFHSKDARLWLYYKFGAGPSAWHAARIFSTDEGKTWSTPERLPEGILGPIKDKPLVLDDGTIVSGSSIETQQSWHVQIERSTDNGITWTKSSAITVPQKSSSDETTTPYGIIQPTIVSLDAAKSPAALCPLNFQHREYLRRRLA